MSFDVRTNTPRTSGPGTNYYVSAAGDDSNDGLTEATAWQTITKVIAEQPYGEGDKVLFRRGDTFTNSGWTVNAVGSEFFRAIFGAYGSGADPILNVTNSPGMSMGASSNWTRTENLVIQNSPNVNWAANAGNHEIVNCTIKDSADQNLGIDDAAVVLVDGCTISGAADDGISSHDDFGVPEITIRNTTLTGNNQHINGLTVSGGASLLIEDSFFGQATNPILINNTNLATIRRCRFVATGVNQMTVHGTFEYCVFDASATSGSTDFRILGNGVRNNCVYYGGTGSNKGDLWSHSDDLTINNCYFVNWQRIYAGDASHDIDLDYCYVDVASTTSVDSNTNEILTAPVFGDPSSDDWKPDALQTGKSVGALNDYYGQAVGSPPKVGVSELAS